MKQAAGARWIFDCASFTRITNPSVLTSQSTFFFPGHGFHTSNSLAFQASYRISKKMKLYGETNRYGGDPVHARAGGAASRVVLRGWAWETAAFSAKANYVSESVAYLPLLGSFSATGGDRRWKAIITSQRASN